MSLDFISPREVLQYIRQGDAVVIDIRDRDAFSKSHIPGAISMPYDDFDETAAVLKEYGTIIICCERGAASLQMGRKLSQKGYNVLSVGGGMDAWRGPLLYG